MISRPCSISVFTCAAAYSVAASGAQFLHRPRSWFQQLSRHTHFVQVKELGVVEADGRHQGQGELQDEHVAGA